RRRPVQHPRAPPHDVRRGRIAHAHADGRRRDGSVRRAALPCRSAVTVRVVIVDDEPVARRGLRHLLLEHPDVAVVGEARNGEEAVPTFGPEPGRVEVNGMQMYYEVSGQGDPLIVLHGAYMNIESMGEIIP